MIPFRSEPPAELGVSPGRTGAAAPFKHNAADRPSFAADHLPSRCRVYDACMILVPRWRRSRC